MEKSKKIREIYNSYIQQTGENDETGQRIQERISELLETRRQESDWKEFEQYRDQIYAVTAVAEEEGFISGFRYAVMLMTECYAGERGITAEP